MAINYKNLGRRLVVGAHLKVLKSIPTEAFHAMSSVHLELYRCPACLQTEDLTIQSLSITYQVRHGWSKVGKV